MLKIRLRRMGSRHRPFYRVVVSDSRQVPTGSALDEIGYYDPRKSPVLLEIDKGRVAHWQERGAQLSQTVRNLLKRVDQLPAAQPAATPEKAEAPAPAEEKAAEASAEDKAEAAAAEEASAEEAKAEESASEESSEKAEES